MKALSILLTVFVLTYPAFTQTKMVLVDRAQMLDSTANQQLADRLLKENIDIVSMVDFARPCDYLYARFSKSASVIGLSLIDCDEKVLGKKDFGDRILTIDANEKSLLLFYAIMDILENPMGDLTQNLEEDSAKIINAHRTRYFFAPSAFNLEEGELYYNAFYFFLHDIQYGLTDNLSMGIGTTIAGIPIYLTPKVSIPLGKKSAIAVGDLFMVGTYGTGLFANLVYTTYSYGGLNGNTSISLGYLSANDNELTSETSSAVYNWSGMIRMGQYFSLVAENYVFGFNSTKWAYRFSQDQHYEEEFTRRTTVLYGMIGFRIVSKRRDVVSWQIGINYVKPFYGEIPDKYKYGWDTYVNEDDQLIGFPTVVYTRKFGGPR
ncbi:MAG: hypothetical protein JXQ90_13560 [Cyclobacteriaceae bacterium]